MKDNINIEIKEKPDWVSWDDIHNVLWNSHSENRAKGIVMRYASLTGEEIRQRVEGNGTMFCALVNGNLIGTAAIVKKTEKFWFDITTACAYLCFVCVLPEFAGQGVYQHLFRHIDKVGKSMGLPILVFDTHENNQRMLEINRKNGFKPVDYKFYKDHFNVVMVRWFNGCPYSEQRIMYQYVRRKLLVKVKSIIKSVFF